MRVCCLLIVVLGSAVCEKNIQDILTELRKDVNTIKIERRNDTVLQEQIQSIEERLHEFGDIIESLTQDVEKLKEKSMLPAVAFLAYRDDEGGIAAGTTIVFENVVMNKGVSYSSDSGVFTAPVHGIYQATVSLRPRDDEAYCAAEIHVEDEPRMVIFAERDSGYYSTGGDTITIELNPADEVKVVSFSQTSFLLSDEKSSFFSCVLLYQL